jgi:hypothetical protein
MTILVGELYKVQISVSTRDSVAYFPSKVTGMIVYSLNHQELGSVNMNPVIDGMDICVIEHYLKNNGVRMTQG